MPPVSVIMAVHNSAEYLALAVESILAQTFRDFEFIIIDDGSTDESAAILKRYADTDNRIRLISRPNKGLTKSLNEGVALAQGEFVARMDADDIASPERFQLQVDFLRAHPEVVLLGGCYDLIDDAGRFLRRMDQPSDNERLQELCLVGGTPICHPLVMMRLDALKRVNGYDESYEVSQDLDLWLRMGEIGQMACLPQVLLKYRLHAKSASEKKQRKQTANTKRACEDACKRRGIERKFMADHGWRATSDRQSRHKYALQYGWWAFNRAQRKTAAIYGFKAIAAMPINKDGWKLLACALIKPMPAPRVS
jgi:glycosyltransferase involved in cell wall biosynthesis